MRYSLRIVEGENKGKEYILVLGDTILGRSKEANIVIDSGKISKKHCCLSWKKEQLSIKDLKSSNGIFVNGTKVEQSDLTHGDRIVIGDSVFVVVEGK